MFFIASALAGGPVVVDVIGARNNTGTIACHIFISPEGFPESDITNVANSIALIKDGRGTCTFPDAPKVPFAVAVIHDEDFDLHLGRSRIGLPTEGYAFTNNVLGWFGMPPSYEKAVVPAGPGHYTISLVY